jgi:Nif-specific regulatory protein
VRRLVLLEGRAFPSSLELADEALLGRAAEAALQVQDETASRRHARIRLLEGRSVLEDLGSANGTQLNGERVERPAVLFDGDVISIGEVRLRFVAGAVAERETVVRDPDADVAGALDPDAADPAREGAGEAAIRRLRLVCDGAALLGDAAEERDVAPSLLALLVDTFRPDRATVSYAPGGGAPRVAAAHPPDAGPPESRTLRRRVLEGGEAVLVVDPPEASLARSRYRSTIAAPLRTSDGVWGIAVLESLEPDRWCAEDLRALAAVTRQAALVLRTLRALAGARAEVGRLVHASREGAPEILGASAAIEEVRRRVARAAVADAPALVTGETGTGKELVARRLHVEGPRRSRPFVALNCAALVEGLLESELFGHEKGAFTGAVERRDGRIAEAGTGTLFLDEVGELPPALQAKLLRVLSERTFTRVGGREPLRMECRLVCATNRDLRREVAQGRFREDLWYRLAVLEIAVPPLRDRGEDVEVLAEALLERIAAGLGRTPPRLAEDARRALRQHAWPGNVRELRNALERAVILAGGDTLFAKDLPAPGPRSAGAGASAAGDGEAISLREAEKRAIVAALARTGGKKGAAALLLGISWPTLNRKIREYGIRESGAPEDGAPD